MRRQKDITMLHAAMTLGIGMDAADPEYWADGKLDLTLVKERVLASGEPGCSLCGRQEKINSTAALPPLR